MSCDGASPSIVGLLRSWIERVYDRQEDHRKQERQRRKPDARLEEVLEAETSRLKDHRIGRDCERGAYRHRRGEEDRYDHGPRIRAQGLGDSPADGAEQRAKEWLEQFGLGKRLSHRPMELSGGEQQRVAIARALINDPDNILADEPTGNLDKAAAEDIMAIINDVRQKTGKTLIMVTHDQELAKKADRIINLKK